MGTIHHEADVQCDAETAWGTIGNFGDLSWFPGVGRTEVSGDNRTVGLGDATLVERLSERDEAARSIRYSIIEGPLGLTFHEATLSVTGEGETCRVRFSVTVEPESAVEMVDAIYKGALAGLTEHLERPAPLT